MVASLDESGWTTLKSWEEVCTSRVTCIMLEHVRLPWVVTQQPWGAWK
jgi:hypothetical protein